MCPAHWGYISKQNQEYPVLYSIVGRWTVDNPKKGKYRVCQMMIYEKKKLSGSTKYWGEGIMGGPWAIVDRIAGERRL